MAGDGTQKNGCQNAVFGIAKNSRELEIRDLKSWMSAEDLKGSKTAEETTGLENTFGVCRPLRIWNVVAVLQNTGERVRADS